MNRRRLGEGIAAKCFSLWQTAGSGVSGAPWCPASAGCLLSSLALCGARRKRDLEWFGEIGGGCRASPVGGHRAPAIFQLFELVWRWTCMMASGWRTDQMRLQEYETEGAGGGLWRGKRAGRLQEANVGHRVAHGVGGIYVVMMGFCCGLVLGRMWDGKPVVFFN